MIHHVNCGIIRRLTRFAQNSAKDNSLDYIKHKRCCGIFLRRLSKERALKSALHSQDRPIIASELLSYTQVTITSAMEFTKNQHSISAMSPIDVGLSHDQRMYKTAEIY